MQYNIKDQNSAAYKNAEKRLNRYVTRGMEQGKALLDTVNKTVIRPIKVFTHDMRFSMADTKQGDLPRYFVAIDGVEHQFSLHSHAFSRMRSEVDLSAGTIKHMIDGPEWDRRNVETLLNSKFQNKVFRQRGGGHARFINLVVGDQVRGFVGRGFKRHLKSGPLLEAFIGACRSLGAIPVEAAATDLRFSLRAMLPYVFTPRDNEHMALGVSFSNSDFGAGSFRLERCVMSLRCGTVLPLDVLNGNGRGESHAGGKGDDDVTDSAELSEDTIAKLIVAKQGEVKDIVASALQADAINSFFDQVAEAMDKKVSWHTFERFMRGKLSAEEMETVKSLLKKGAKTSDLPDVEYTVDGDALMDAWFASNLIGKMASQVKDPERAEDLQQQAGKLLMR